MQRAKQACHRFAVSAVCADGGRKGKKINMKTPQGAVSRYSTIFFCCLAVWLSQSQLFAFSIGAKVQANGLVYVRATAGGTYLGQQASGTIGTVLAGPTYSQIGGTGTYYYWYSIDWPSAPDGWVADIGLIAAQIPASPTSLSASGGTSSITISWTDNANNEQGFYIERKIGAGGTWGYYAAVGANVTSYTDTSVVAGNTYYYRVYAYNAAGYSLYYSNEASAALQSVPASPTSLSASGGTSSITISWTDNANNEQGFYIERKIGTGGAWGLYASVGANVTSYTDTSVVAGNTYYYRVYAYNAAGPSQYYSNEASASLQSVPASPTLLAASGGTSAIGLGWQDNANNEQGFYIERKIGAGGTWVLYASVGANVTGYTDTGVVVGNTYYYRVYAYNAAGPSPYYSNEASAALQTIPASPTSLSASGGTSSIALSWTDNANNEQGFYIERKTGSGGTWAYYAAVGANVTTYTDTGVVAGNTYYYRVYAYNAVGASLYYSNEASAALQGASLSVSIPNGGENWTAGSTHNVTWTISGNTSQISYQLVGYSTDGGSTYTIVSNDPLNAQQPASARSFSWTLPSGVSTTQGRVQVTARAANTSIVAQDASDADFTIAPILTVTAPNGGENWTAGTTHSITWSVSGSTANVWYYKVALSTDSGATWPVGTADPNDLTPNGIFDPNARSFSWTISSSLNTTQARIRVRAIDFNGFIIHTLEDTNDANFTISSSANPTIRIAPLQLNFDCASAQTPPPSQTAAALTVKPSWDGILRGMSASPFPFEETQPDGSKVTLFIRGGVKFYWLEDTNGFTVVRDKGTYVYAQLDSNGALAPTTLQVGKDDPRRASIKPRTLPSAQVIEQMSKLTMSTPATGPTSLRAASGNVKNVVILMRFANHTGRTLPTVANFNTIFNAVGGDPTLAPSGSVRDVYYENSYGAMTLNSTVFAWVTLPHTEAYYADGVSGRGTKFKDAITDALNLADPLVNFSQFDDDLDGFVDTITFIHSGYGAESGGTDPDGAATADRIWSHRSAITTWTSAEGVKVRDYDVNPAFWGITGTQPTHIGVISHETGHFFGLPDLYDTDQSSAGAGSWCMMANSWGFTGDQRNPPHFSAWCKIFLGWVTPAVISSAGTYTSSQAESSPSIFRINNGYPSGEYLLIENRQPAGFDRNIPQGGLAVWHVDENKTDNTDEGYPGQAGWPANGHHYHVALLQADGNYDLETKSDINRGDSGDLFRNGAVAEVSHTTVPNTDAYQGGNIVNTGNRIYGISSSGSSMTFNFSSSSAPGGSSFVIYNDGPGTLTVNSIALDQSASWITWSAPATPFNVVSGGSQTVTVSVDCSQAPTGQSTRRLLVYSTDSGNSPYPGGVNVTVTTPSPAISVTPASRDFGSIQASTTADRTFSVQNNGGGMLSGSASVAAPFSIVSGGSYNLGAGASQTVTVRYSPTVSGTDNQNVSFTGGGGATRPVSGSAYLSPAISVTPASQDFSSIQVGTTADRTFSVQNTGGGTLSGSASVSVPFSIVSGGSYSLGASASQTVTVRYSPTAPGTHNQNVSFTGGTGATRPVGGSATVTPPIYLSGIGMNNGVFQFMLNGPVGSNCVTKVSSNLVTWSSLYTNTIPVGGSVLVSDPRMTNQPRRFYRVITQ
jgi:M6 family metalloprotease-like protein